MDNQLENDLYRENLRIAPLFSRVGAYIIDMVLISFLCSVLFSEEQANKLIQAQQTLENAFNLTQSSLDKNIDNSAFLNQLRGDSKAALDVMFFYAAIFAALEIVYNFIFWYFYGATLGQILLRIKVVNVRNFDKPTLHFCMFRAVMKYAFGTAFLFGFVFAFADRFRRTLYDRMSKTIVISN